MKKKIKDLTLEEIKKICNKYSCNECPLNIPHSCHCYGLALVQGFRWTIKEEREVEVDESNSN